MPRTTIAQACRDRKIDRKDWDEAKRQGVDPWDRKAMADWLASRRPRIAKDARVKDAPVGEDVTIEEMERAVRVAESYEDVKILKEKIASLYQAQKMRKESGELLSRRDVDERDTRIAAAVKGALLKFTNDAPPMLEGLAAAKMQKILKAQMFGVLEQLASDQSEFWKQ